MLTSLRHSLVDSIKRWSRTLEADRVIGPFAGIMQRAQCLADYVDWCRRHPTTEVSGRLDLFDAVATAQGLRSAPIDYWEFGVYEGRSMRWWVKANRHPESRFVGFDTFEGLPEAWGTLEPGAFSTGGRTPQIDDPRVRFVAGLFQDTLRAELKAHPPTRRLVVNLDADLYSSTLFVLTTMVRHTKPGDLLLFDEMNSVAHEFRAFRDFEAAFGPEYEVVGAAGDYAQVALELK